jgi:integral membrane protein (TIGR00529 family)
VGSLIKVVLVFAFIVFLTERKVHMSISMALGTLALAILCRMDPISFARTVIGSVLDLETLSLLGTLLLIFMLEASLEASGQLNRIISGMKEFIGDTRMVMAAIPALIGLLPMPGGAMFSAPIMESAGAGIRTSPEEKTFINYWFRHLWEYAFPLYPGVVLASHLGMVEISKFMMVQSILSASAIAAGISFLLRKVEKAGNRGKVGYRRLLLDLSPILLVVFLLLLRLNIILTLLLSIALVLASNRIGLGEIPYILKKGFYWRLLLLVVGVMVFKGTLEGSGALKDIVALLVGLRSALPFIFFAIPFIGGLLTGLTVGYIGMSFPMLMPLIPDGSQHLGYIVLAYASGYIGVLLSPFHLCLVLTAQYFGADMVKMYKILIPYTMWIMLVAFAIFSYFLWRG